MTNSTEIEAGKVPSVQPATNEKRSRDRVPTFMEAFEFFLEPGGELGKDFEDWWKAEHDVLRPVPVEMTESDAQVFATAAVPAPKPGEIEVDVEDDVLIFQPND